MKNVVALFFIFSGILSADDKIDHKIMQELNSTIHNKPQLMKQIARHWSNSKYRNWYDIDLEVEKNGVFKDYPIDRIDDKIGYKGKFWVYPTVKETCTVWKRIVEKNGIVLNKYYPNICNNIDDASFGAIVYSTALSKKTLSNGFWYLAKFSLVDSDTLLFTDFQGRGRWYIQKKRPIKLELEKKFKEAVYSNNAIEMKELIDTASKNHVKINLDEMFLLAAEVANLDTVKLILQNGANVNYVNNYGNALTRAAMRDSNLDKIRFILKSGFDTHNALTGDNSPIFNSALTRQYELIKFWLDMGININLKKSNGETPIMSVCRNTKNIWGNVQYYNTLELLKYMISKGADPLVKTKNSVTTLHLITQLGTVEQVKYIYDFFKNVNIQDNNGKTPLHYAVEDVMYDDEERILSVVKYLLRVGANKKIKTLWGKTPYDLAKRRITDSEILKLLK